MKQETYAPNIEYHADDYGLFLTQSRRILDCVEKGVLNALSVMANGPCLASCMEMLRPYRDSIDVAVHLNFIEGKAFCPGLLTDGSGNFRVGFGTLLIHSYLPGRRKYRAALQKEIQAQIHGLLPYLDTEKGLRIDGHAHYHMLPVVFDALMDVIRKENLKIPYIRIPKDSLRPYLRCWGKLEGFRFINLIKVLILDILAWRNQWKYRTFFSGLERKLFLGVLFSGNMSLQNVCAVLPEARAAASQKGCGIEVLAHPGGLYEPEDTAQLTDPNDLAFMTSEARKLEADMLLGLKTFLFDEGDRQ